MARVEIEEHELQSGKAVISAVNEMLNNSEARKLLMQARKKANPNVILPEFDTQEQVKSDLEQMREMLAADKAERQREREEMENSRKVSEFTKQWERKKRGLRERGFTDEGIQAVEAFAQENGIADIEIAADAYEKRNPPPEPVQSSSARWNFFDQPEADDNFTTKMIESRGENEGALDAEIQRALRDVRQPGARR